MAEPWQMSRAEWQAAFLRAEINFSGCGGNQWSTRCTSERGIGKANAGRVAEQSRLKMRLPDVDGIPARWPRVIEHALSVGLPVPLAVRREFTALAQGAAA